MYYQSQNNNKCQLVYLCQMYFFSGTYTYITTINNQNCNFNNYFSLIQQLLLLILIKFIVYFNYIFSLQLQIKINQQISLKYQEFTPFTYITGLSQQYSDYIVQIDLALIIFIFYIDIGFFVNFYCDNLLFGYTCWKKLIIDNVVVPSIVKKYYQQFLKVCNASIRTYLFMNIFNFNIFTKSYHMYIMHIYIYKQIIFFLFM
eukprot:TRINITY_DN42577_c0_g1_i1.p1 TRINITY_DN42577_c0_g1~~TRINITY_DN42577_c0_g1_i1.p1  ORF type:complete len:202 (+),score=-13.83 TRINITY_DN42577_c0_g1_i1:111-716(+)